MARSSIFCFKFVQSPMHSDAAYMPIGTQFTANINLSATKKDADIVLAPNSLKLPEIWHGLSPERVQKAVNLDAIIPALKQAIAIEPIWYLRKL